jgi:ubiquinone/menaquinone biosynthesis C-methylase UbiE
VKSQDSHFDQVAEEYDATIPEHVIQHLTARRVALVESLALHGNLLDVGCGTGRFLSALPARYTTTGVDVSAGMLDIARQKGLEVEQASSAELPFEDKSFDVVATFAVLHHLIDPDLVRASIREMVRVARSGGAVIVWDHNPLNPYWKFLMSKSPQDQGDERLVPARLILDTFRQTSARTVCLRRMTFTPDFTPSRALPMVVRLERMFERVPLLNLLAAHNVAIARI